MIHTTPQNCTNHQSSKEDKEILQIMTWPLQFPDLQSELSMNKLELFTHLHATWESLPWTYFYKFLESGGPRIFSAVINARGKFFDEKKIEIWFNWNYN